MRILIVVAFTNLVSFCGAYLLQVVSCLQGDDDMVVVAYADDTNFYVREAPLMAPVVAPAIGVDDPDTLVPDTGIPVVLSAYEEWCERVDVLLKGVDLNVT